MPDDAPRLRPRSRRALARTLLAVAVGGAAGALSRVVLRDTLVANTLGCLALALLLALGESPLLRRHPSLRAGAAAGFLGAFTTFSTLCAEIGALWLAGRPGAAALRAAASLALGAAAVAAGHGIGRSISRRAGWHVRAPESEGGAR